MAKLQVYASNEVVAKINAIIDKRKVEGAKDVDVSLSSITTMLIELGLRVYEAQMERKENPFNQHEFNKVILENILKCNKMLSKILAMESLAPYVQNNIIFDYESMVKDIKETTSAQLSVFFPNEEEE